MLVRLLAGGLLLLLAAPAAAQASVTISDASVTEINGDGAVATFTVTRSAGLLTGNTEVGFATVDGSAHAPADYAAASGTLFFGSLPLGGTQVQEVSIAVKGDALDEAAETFRLALSGSPEIADDSGLATITDNDPPPVAGVANAPAAPEGGTATFTITLNAPSGRDVSVPYGTADGSAVAGQDYAAASGTATIPAGSTAVGVGVALLDDGDDEPTENFELRLGPPGNAGLGTAAAAATILDNDEPAPPAPAPESGPNTSVGSTTPSPPLSPLATGPATAATGTATNTAVSRLGVSSPRLKRPATILVTVSCPRQASLCDGQVTVFSRANLRSKIKLLRKERRLGARLFKLSSGATRTLQIALSKTDRVLLLRTGRLNVRAFAVTEDSAGTTGVRRVTGTLIFRTSHS